MRVTTLTPSLSRAGGGVSESARRLAQSLGDQAGIEINVLGLKDRYMQEDLTLWTPLRPTGCAVMGPAAFGYSLEMKQGLEASDPDLIHVHGLWMYPSVIAAHRAARTGKPNVVTVHGMLEPWALKNARLKKSIAAHLYENRHLRGAACVHALCVQEAQTIRAYGLKNPVCLIPNGVDLPVKRKLYASPLEREVLQRKMFFSTWAEFTQRRES